MITRLVAARDGCQGLRIRFVYVFSPVPGRKGHTDGREPVSPFDISHQLLPNRFAEQQHVLYGRTSLARK